MHSTRRAVASQWILGTRTLGTFPYSFCANPRPSDPRSAASGAGTWLLCSGTVLLCASCLPSCCLSCALARRRDALCHLLTSGLCGMWLLRPVYLSFLPSGSNAPSQTQLCKGGGVSGGAPGREPSEGKKPDFAPMCLSIVHCLLGQGILVEQPELGTLQICDPLEWGPALQISMRRVF